MSTKSGNIFLYFNRYPNRIKGQNMHYLIHLPHCGINIPQTFISDYLLSSHELKNNIYEYCDLYTDELFDSLYKKFGGIKNNYSRFFFDPERFSDDSLEEMHQKYKLGWFYENTILDKKILRDTKNKNKVKEYYKEYHKNLEMKTQEKLDLYNQCTIIDCHSFSNQKYWFQDKNLDFQDICIGYEEEHCNYKLVEMIKNEFKDYKVAINSPYSGSIVPLKYYKTDLRVKSVMIEINKRIYLENDNITKNKNFNQIKRHIDNISLKLR